MKPITNLYLSIAILFASISAQAQLQTFWSPFHLLVGTEFLGTNFAVSNVQFTGSYYAIGSFEASSTNIGLPSGILITTGSIYGNSSGPIGPNNMSNAGFDNSIGGSTLLTGIAAGNNTYNAATLEFDFVPSIDSLKLKYIFGSEEYPEYAPPNSSTFNDVFGIFISGPGLTGVQNIAKLPNGSIVSINNVNMNTNSTYYVNNGNGSTSPFNTSPEYIQYDGYTTVLETKVALQIGETYHLIIAIADVNDGIYDSGLFIGSCETCDFNASLEDHFSKTALLYPNPANNELKLHTEKTVDFVRIIDVSGKSIGFYNDVNSINVSSMQNGIYFAQFVIDNKVFMERFTIEH